MKCRMKNNILIVIMLLCFGPTIFAQDNLETKGAVIDKLGNPIGGVLISVEGNSTIKTTTAKDGTFSIAVQKGERIIVNSFDNRTKIIEADGSNITIVLESQNQNADIGFGILQTIEESTGAISRTNYDQIDKRSSMSLSNSLFGNALGLTSLQNSGPVWENYSSFSIRGLQTLSDNNILILVDGFERPISELVPEEVESVSILRDAAAVALYGYRGVNGILSIKTKRGKYNGHEIKVKYDHAFNFTYRLPQFANSYTYASAMNEALTNDHKNAQYSQDELDAFKSGKYPYLYPDIDWVNETLRDHGSSNIYNVSFRGGTTRMRYYTMLNLQSNSGYIKNSDADKDYPSQLKYSQANIRTNLDIELSPTTTLEANLLGILNEHNRPGRHHNDIISALYTLPSAAYPIKTYDGIWSGNSTWPETNPVAGVQGTGKAKGHARTLYADAKITQQLGFITDGLKASLRIGYDNKADYWENTTKNYIYAYDRVSMVNGLPADTVRTTGGKQDDVEFSSSLGYLNRHFNFVGNIDYEKIFNDHKLFASFIYSYDGQSSQGQNNTLYRQNFAGYVHYGWQQKYYADLALVVSGSNRLAKNHKYAFSPTFSAAWIASNEDFLKGSDIINFLKLRASAGIIHADFIPANNFWEQTFDGSSTYPLGENYNFVFGGISEGRLPSDKIKKERAIKYNFGVDATILKSFALTADLYYQRRDNIFVSSSGGISSILGISPAFTNAGIVDSYGAEVGLNYENKIGDILLFTGGKFTFNRSKIKQQLEEPRAYSYLERTGKRINQIFGLQAIGFFVDEAEIANSPIQQFSDVKPGDVKYKDQNGDGIINEFDETAIGYNTSVPEIYFSFDLGVEWKGIGANLTFQGVGNYSKMLNTRSIYMPLIDNTTISNHYYENRWTPENPFSKYPRLTTEKNDNNYRNNTIWLADASFVKLRNIELYYKFGNSFLSSLKMESAKLYVRGVDLLCFDKIDISDPESIGVSYPMTRSINVGFSLGF